MSSWRARANWISHHVNGHFALQKYGWSWLFQEDHDSQNSLVFLSIMVSDIGQFGMVTKLQQTFSFSMDLQES